MKHLITCFIGKNHTLTADTLMLSITKCRKAELVKIFFVDFSDTESHEDRNTVLILETDFKGNEQR